MSDNDRCTQCAECLTVYTGANKHMTRCLRCGMSTFKSWPHEVFVQPPDREVHLKRDELHDLLTKVNALKWDIETLLERAANEENLDKAFKEDRTAV